MLCYLTANWIDAKSQSSGNALKNVVLVVFSLLFYAWGEPVYVFLMMGCVLVNYVMGLAIAHTDSFRKAILSIGIGCNLAILGTFKYSAFLTQAVNSCGFDFPVPQIALPIGISFYVFQSISYLVDVYRGESPVQRSFGRLLLYISMFPQLIAGPIVRYGTVAHEISHRHVNRSDVADGIYRFLIGLGKKVVLANQLSEVSDLFLVQGLSHLTTVGAWVGIVAYTLQIYFDFSGYSDMAIGIGRCLGFHFKENFNHPYCCNSITDFWRRWHQSLGSFFRDYVYIPMGGNRRHQAFNILVVWFLTGMWHGASWNFIIWGMYFGVIVMLEKYTLLKVQHKIPALLLHIYSLLIVIAGWGIFYFDDFHALGVFFNAFVGNAPVFSDFAVTGAMTDHFWLWIVAVVFCMPVRRWASTCVSRVLASRHSAAVTLTVVSRAAVSVLLLALSVALLVGATNNAFIYTRF